MRASLMEIVLGRLEERDRTTRVPQRGRRAALHLRQPRQRPVQADAHVRIVVARVFRERLAQHLLRALEVARVAQRVAQIDPVARPQRCVVGREKCHLFEAVAIELDRTLDLPQRAVRASECCEDVVAVERRRALERECLFEARNGRRVLAALVGGQRESDSRARRARAVSGSARRSRRAPAAIAPPRGIPQAERQLGFGEP